MDEEGGAPLSTQRRLSDIVLDGRNSPPPPPNTEQFRVSTPPVARFPGR